MSPFTFSVRAAREEDLPAIRALLSELGSSYRNVDAERLQETFRRAAGLSHLSKQVAVGPTGVVEGMLSLSHLPQPRLCGLKLSVDELAVSESARGTGVGSALLKSAIEEARRLGAVRLEVLTDRRLESYRRGFYSRRGFVEGDSAVFRRSRFQFQAEWSAAAHLSIRLATLEDAPALAGLLGELGYPFGEIALLKESLGAVLGHPQLQLWVAAGDGELLGMISLSRLPQLRLTGDKLSVDELVVSERSRGQGVGQALMATAIREAQLCAAVRLEVLTHRARESYRRGFYAKNGLEEVPSAVLRYPLKG